MAAGSCRARLPHLGSRCRDGCSSEVRRALCGRGCLPRAGLAPCSAAAVEAMRPSCSDGGMGSAADATGERKRGGLKLLLSLLSACCAVPCVVSGGGARQFGGAMGATGGRQTLPKASSSTAVGVLPAFLTASPPPQPDPRPNSPDPPPHLRWRRGIRGDQAPVLPRGAREGSRQAPAPAVGDMHGITRLTHPLLVDAILAQCYSRRLRTAEGAQKGGSGSGMRSRGWRLRAIGLPLALLMPAATPRTPASPPAGTRQPQQRGPQP